MVNDAFASWQAETAKADTWLDALEKADLAHTVSFDAGAVAISDVLVHVIEEYARHFGYADLLRVGIDGRTGQ